MTEQSAYQARRADLTIEETAHELNCSVMHVYRMLNRGTISAYKVGRNTRVRRESLDALKNNNPWKPSAQRADEDRPGFLRDKHVSA